MTVPTALASDIETTLKEQGGAGDMRAESCGSVAVCIVYLAQLPGDEMVAWHAKQVKGISAGGTVDLTACDRACARRAPMPRPSAAAVPSASGQAWPAP